MNNSNLIKTLKSFSSREWKKLLQMLQSPYFNSNKKCIDLFYLIKEGIANETNLTKALLHTQLFPAKENQDRALSMMLNRISSLAEEVLIQEQLRLRPHYRNYLLMEGLNERDNQKAIKKVGRKSLQLLEQQKKVNYDDRLYYYLITNVLYELKVAGNVNLEESPKQVATALDAFYLSRRFPLAYEMYNLQQILSQEYRDILTEKILSMSQYIDLEKHRVIQLYQRALLLVRGQADHFPLLKKELLLFADFIPKVELHTIYTISCNYCVAQIIQGKKGFHEELFLLYQRMIDQNVLFITNYIPAAQIKNVVTLSCQVGHFEWAQQFLKNHRDLLAPDGRTQLHNYYLATIFFYQKNYEKARELLVQTENLEIFFDIGRKFFLLKIYYELQEEIALFQLLDAFKAFIRQNKSLSSPIKKAYLNFSKLLQLLANARVNCTAKKWNQLKVKLNSYAHISDKKWLLEKLEELMGSR